MTNNYNLRGRSLMGLRRWWLMLTGIFLLTLFGAKHSLNAQSITNYTFAASSGTFTPLSGGTSVPSVQVDDGASGALPIGFSFVYMGQAYTSLFASSNGILTFGAGNSSLTNNMSTGTGRPIIAPLWDDLAGTVGSAAYITTGAPGNRVFTFEWLNWRYPLGSAVATISMQVNLYEADGKIEFIYRQEPNPLAGLPSASVGLAGPLTGAGNFLSLDSVTTTPIVSSTVETTTINARPATGQIYSFTPPAAPASPTGLTFSAVTINSMTLNWTDATGEVGYIVERSLDGVTYTAVATLPANTISYVATGLSASQTYYWNIRSFSEGQISNPALNGNQATAAGTLCGVYIVPINYPTLTAALNDIRTNGLLCSVEIQIDGGLYSSAGETFPIWVGGLGTLPGKTVKIVPILSPVNITSAHPWATIVDSLAEYVTIDGRDFGTGSQLLTIQNTFNSGSAMRVVQESSNNNFQYINFRGQNNTTTGGVVFMGGSTVVGGSGNDNNLFNECDIHDNGALFPVNGFLSSANTTGASNDNNTISNCRVYNFYSTGLATVGINLLGLNNNWNITGNRIYQDAARNFTTGNIHKGIVANNTLGTFNISNNIIGYASSTGTGTYSMAWATTAIANRFFGMDLNVAVSPVSTISGNEIASFNIATSSSGTGSGAPFCGIWLNAGGANITGNTVGSMSGTDNILVRGTVTGGSATTANVIGIAQGAASASSITISNNNIGGLGFNGITAAFANAAAIGGTVCGIFNQGATTLTVAGSNRTISGNTIGGTGVANSMRSGNALNAGFTTTANFSVIGILNTGSTRMNISNNTVQNLSVPTRSSAGVVYGIHTTTGINTITGNTVHTLTTNGKNVGTTTAAQLIGISHTSITAPVAGTEVNIAQNTVRNLKINSDSSLVIVNGISFTGSTTTGFNYLIQRNNIYDIGDLTLTAADTAKVTYNGIGLFGGIATVQNNMISLGDGNTKSQIYQGIVKSNTNINRIYHNSVYIGGTASTASGLASGSTWAFRRTARPTTGNDEIINNIFYNARTTAIGGAFEYATGLDTNINVTASKNILFADFANGGRTGIRNLTIATSMTDWRTLTGQDLNSISENPNYIAPAAVTPDLHLQVPPALVPAEQAGQLIASVLNDYDGDVRAAFTPNDIGADAGNFLPSGDYLNPTISSVTATPATGACTAVNHDVLAVVTDASGLTSVTLNWSLNGVAQVGIPMVNTSGNNWEAQLPASGNALVSFSVTAVDASVNLNAETSASQSYRDEYLQAGLSAGLDQTICPGTSTNLSVASPYLNSIVFSEISGFETGTGAGPNAPGITGQDYIELTNIGNQPVDISGWRLEITGSTPGVFIIPAGNTVPAGGTFTLARTGGGAAIPGFYVNSTLLSVGSATSQGFIISDLGGNISDVVAINGGTPFNPVGSGTPAVSAAMWSGTIASSSGTAGIRRTAFSDSNTAADWTVAGASNLTNYGNFNVGLGTISVASISWSSGGTGSIETVTPVASPTDYIVTIDDGACTASDTVVVSWFSTLPAPIAYDSIHCGNQQALCDVSSVPGAVAYRWYTTPTGGTPIQNLPDTNLLQNVAITTIFYVAAFDGVCDGPRVAVTETVTAPSPVDIVATVNDTVCLGEVVTLDATNSNPNYVFIWSGNGVGTLNVNNVQTVISTPTAVGNYTFIVTATDAGAGCVTTDTLVLVVNPNPNASANIDQTTICDGESVQLEVSGTLLATIGENDAQNTTTSYPAAYGSFYWGHRQQILIRASELTAAGFTAGPISSLAFDVTGAAGQPLTGFSISMAHTAANDLSAQQAVGTVVFGPVNYTSTVGVNTHTFTTPFVWNGTSNVVIETCFNNASYTTNAVTKLDNTAFISCRWLNADNATVCTSAIGTTASQRPQMILNGTALPSGVTFSWSPATGLSATNISNPVATPTTSTTYVVTVTDPTTGCVTLDTVIINVLPVLPAPSTNSSTQCGTQIPTASVNAVPGATAYYWFDAPTGGTILQANPSLTFLSPIASTVTLYISAFDGTCLSPRTPVTITVTPPPAITASASDSTICAGVNTINLNEILGNYTSYSWTVNAGGDLNSTSGAAVTASPSLPGTYDYIVTGTDGFCTNSDTVSVTVFDLPTVNANIQSAAFCEGGSVQLDVPSTATIGENDAQSTTTGYPSAYGSFYWGYRMQNLILASELTAAGFSAGPINALSYNIATPAGQTLTGYTIKMANVAAADLSVEQTVSTVVYGPVNYNSTAGLNTHTFSSAFIWDGVSNLAIETCFNNGNYTTNSVGNMDNTSFVSSRWRNQDAAGVCALATTGTASQRPQMVLTRSLTGVSYSWSPAAGLSATNIPNPIASPTVSTNYVVTVTDNATGCTNTDTVFITVTPLPAAPTTNSPITRCGPGDVTATATGTGGTLFWTGPNGGNVLSYTGSLTQSVTASGAFDVREFPANLDTTAVGYNPIVNPSAPAGYFPTTSQGMWFRVLNTGGTIIKSVDIYPNGPIGTPYGIAIIDSLGNTIGSVSGITTVTAPNYETIEMNIYVPYSTIPYAMRPTSSPNLSVHQNATVQGTAPWQIAGDINIIAYGNMPPLASFFTTTTFGMFYNWQVMHGCFGNEAVVNYTVNPAPLLVITPSGPTTFCGNGVVALDAGAAPTDPGYVNFSWAPAAGLSATNVAAVTATVNATTTYTVTADDGIPGGCINTASVTLTVNTAPFADVGIVPDTICTTSPYQFNGTGGSASYKYVGTTENLGQTAGWPFNGANAAQRMQLFVSAAELNAAGVFGPSFINSVGFNVVSKLSNQPYTNFTVSIDEVVGGCFVSTTYLTIPGGNTVYTGNYSTTVGWNDIVFQTPYAWDGVSDIVIQTCFTNATNSLFDIVYTSQTLGCNSTNALNAAACGAATGALTDFRPNLRFQGGSVNYSWSPVTELSASNIANPIFTQSLGVGNRQYVLTVTDPVSGCTATDTANFYVSPTPVTPSIEFVGLDTSICISGSVSFSSVFVDGSLQWQSSADNVNFFDVIGQTGSTYTTGLITADTYIRLKAFCADSAYSNVKYVKVNNPTILTTENDTVCGQGNVTLNATANPGYFIRWFADSTSGNYLANGSPYNTFVTQTDTFWVAALVDTLVGSGGDTLTTTFAGGNGASGNFFDVNVSSPVTLTGMRINNGTAGAICEVWYRNGTHVGFEGSSAGWTQIFNGPVAAAQGFVTGLNLPLSTGVTSFFVFLPGGGITYTNGTSLGAVYASDANIAILEGYGTGGTFGSGLFGGIPTSTRIWNGSFIYAVPNCVSARVPVIAVVNPAPAVTVTPSAATICEGSSVNIDVTGGLGDYTNFDWAPAAGLNTISGTSVIATPSVTTSYIVTATGNINGCETSDTAVITVNPAPVITASTTTPNLCTGDTAQVSVNISSPLPGNYTVAAIPYAPLNPAGSSGWSAGPSGDDLATTVALPFNFTFFGASYNSVNIVTNGYIYFGANIGFGPYGSAIPNAAAPNNVIAMAWEDLNVVTPDSVRYYTVGVAPNRRWVAEWVNVDFFVTGGNVSGQIVLNEADNTIDVYHTNIDNIGNSTSCGIENASGTYGITPAGRNFSVWTPNPLTNEAWKFSPVPAASISWSGQGIIGATNTPSISAVPTTSGYYTVVVTNPSTGCTKADSVLINFASQPKPVIVDNDTTLCNPDFIYVNVVDTGIYVGGYPAGTNFTWSAIGVPIPDLDSISSSNGSSYSVIVTLPNGCSASSDTATILTKSVAVVDVITSASCTGGGSIAVTVTSGLPNYQYIWSTDLAQTNIISNVTKANNQDTLSNLTAGTYYLQVYDEAGSPASCNSGVLTYVVGGTSPIVIDSVVGTNISCTGFADGTATVYYTGGTAPYSIVWSDGQFADVASRNIAAGGTYTVIVSDGSGCADTASVTIVEPLPLGISLSSTPASISGPGSATAVGVDGTAPYTYDWLDSLGINPVGSGSPINLPAGLYYGLVTDANGCQFADTIRIDTLTNATFNLTMLFEGFYDGLGGLNPALLNSGVGLSATECDTIYVELRDQLNTLTVLASGTAVLNTSGQASFTFPGSVVTQNGYIAVFHRNAVQTWSDLITFSSVTNYNFTTGASQAFGSNMIAVAPGVFAFYSGDLSPQDEFIDILDQGVIDNDIANFASGYVVSDLNGDGFVDIVDQSIVDNNIFNFIGSVHP